jgi:hypothetical protein
MHTIVLHFGKKYEDWHLVEPFYYKLMNQRKITFYWEEEAFASRPLILSLVERIIEQLDREQIKDWQLVILLNLNNESNRRWRLATHLGNIRASLLEPLRDKGFYPMQTVLHLLDMLKRDSHNAPMEEQLRRYWELDQYGYLRVNKEETVNAFTIAEMRQLEQAWGKSIELQNIVLDQPSHEFMETLENKCKQVRACLSDLISSKLKLYRNEWTINQKDDWVSPKLLIEIMNDFNYRLDKLKQLPISPSLRKYNPSYELANCLKYYVGIPSQMGDIRLTRQEVTQNSYREKIKGYLELTYFLLTISHHPNLIERIEKGSASIIQVVLEEERLETLLKNYYMSLHQANRDLEDQLLLQNRFQINRFSEEDFAPYKAASLEKKTAEKWSHSIIKKVTPTFFDEWQNQLSKAERIFTDRKKELERSSKEAIQKLNVIKRRNEFLEEDDMVEITDYKQQLRQQIAGVEREVIESRPSLSEALYKWKQQMTEAEKKMQFLLQKMPNRRQLSISSTIIFLILLFPFLESGLSVPSPNGAIMLSAAGLSAFVTFFGFVVTRERAQSPVMKFYEETSQSTEDMYQSQVESQHRYNHYLNLLFQLFSLRRYHDKVAEIGEELKELNILHRYHLIKLKEFEEMAGRLLHILHIDKEEHLEDRQDIRVPAIRFEKSVMENPVYSPFQQLGSLKLNGHGIEVYLGSAREQYSSTYINELNRIRIQEDKVYRL